MGSGSSSGGDWGRGANGAPPSNAHIIYKIGVYGWRKRCLYVFILMLLVIVIINFALTIWILKVMNFSTDGMGKLRIVPEGIRVEGHTEFLKTLYASHIASLQDTSLHISSSRNITLKARDSFGDITNTFYIGNGNMKSYASSFQIISDGKTLFSANKDQVLIGAERLKVSGGSGAVFTKSVQTPLVRPDDSQSLRLESPSKSLYVRGPEGVNIRASAGTITLTSLDDITLTSVNKAIRLDAKNISIPNMLISRPEFDGNPYPDVYQLCICRSNGKLFISEARGNCQATGRVCQ